MALKPHHPRPVKVIGVASGLGAQDPGTADGPRLLRELKVFQDGAPHATWEGMLRPASGLTSPVETISELCTRIAHRVESDLAAGKFPLVVGGDHSCAIGTWSGARRWLGGPLGLIWLDAHMDSHTFATSPSRALHGMPLAALLGYGDPSLTSIASSVPKLRPEHVCLLGVRSYEESEAALLKTLGVRVIGMDEVRRLGVPAALAAAMAVARNGTAGYGVSIDLDVLDPAEEPGVGSPAPNGILCSELEQALRQLRDDPAMLAMEIVEYNPHRDPHQLTAKAAGALFRAAMGG
jgi:arginase